MIHCQVSKKKSNELKRKEFMSKEVVAKNQVSATTKEEN